VTPAPPALLAARLEAVRRTLAERDLHALLVTHRPNVYYLTNFASSAGVALVSRDAVVVFADSRYTTALDELLAAGLGPPSTACVPVGGSGSYDEVIAAWLLERAGGARVGFEAAEVTVKRHAWLADRLAAGAAAGAAAPSLHACDDVVERLRSVKDAHEVALLREAGRRLSEVASGLLPAWRASAGRTELDLAAEVDHRVRLAGFERPAFDTIVASGPNSALPHAQPTDRRIGPGELLLLDFGGVYKGYCVDLTRTVVAGDPGERACALYRAVADAQDAALVAVRAGVGADEVDAAARRALTARGWGEAFSHATGHGLGLEIHEAPRVAQRRPAGPPPATLEAGMVITIEPGAYVPGLGGVRLEDDVLVTADGAERITHVPREANLMGDWPDAPTAATPGKAVGPRTR
jgi:Xaa-Pro aminopeptidase